MTLFTTLLVLIVERLFKLGEHWQLDHRLEALFRRITHFSMLRTMGMTAIAMVVTFLLLQALKGLLFNVPPDCNEREFLRELQNALLWINFRFYLAPLFWFIVGGPWGPVTLVGYAFLRAWQTWLARYQTPHQRLQSGIDAILHVLDWIPVRLAGVVYALLGHGEKALPAWFASLADLHTSQYQVLTRLAQFSLAREPHTDKVETPKAAVSMAKKASFVVVVIIALLTIYGALV